mmetsp:Transcript_11651/g.33097  ORF Transcript_11651/g.33097 Transcript_11651/m.33097 type:complete len:234 (-) Transcript_11651:1595-2296(-)
MSRVSEPTLTTSTVTKDSSKPIVLVVSGSVVESGRAVLVRSAHRMAALLLESVDHLVNLLILTIQEGKLFFGKDFREAKHSHWYTELDNNRESDCHHLHGPKNCQKNENEDLNARQQMLFSKRNILGVGHLRKAGRLHKEHLEAMPELVGGKRRDAHEEEHTIQDGDGDHAKEAEGKDTGQYETVDEDVGQPRLDDLGDASLVVLFGHGLDVDNGGNGRSDKPGEADDTVGNN